MIAKTVAYYRNSTELQENSIQMQQSMALSFCSKNRIILDEEFEDSNTSARKISLYERPNLNKIIKQIESGQIKAIVVYKRDRLARNVEEHLILYKLFKKHNVKVHFSSLNEHPMHYSPVGEYLETILGAMTEHEGNQISQRILETRIANYTKGISLGTLPFGYDRGEEDNGAKVIVRNEIQLDIVRFIFNTLINDEHNSIKSVLTCLKDQNHIRYTKKNEPRPWDSKQIKDIVSNKMYAGTRVMKFNNISYLRSYDSLAIVTEDEWTKANNVLESLLNKNVTKDKFRCPFSKILFCKACRSNLSLDKRMKNGINIRTVICKNKGCDTKPIANLDEINERIKEQSYYFFKNLLSEYSNDLYKRQQKQNIERLQQLIKNNNVLLSQKENHNILATEEWLRVRTTKLKEKMLESYRQLKVLKKEIDIYYELLEKIMSFNENLKEVYNFSLDDTFNDLDNEELEEYYSNLLDGVYIGKYDIDFQFKHPFFTAKELYIDEQ